MNPIFFVTLILAVVAGIFFVWGTMIASPKHTGAGGIFLTVAVIIMLLIGNAFV